MPNPDARGSGGCQYIEERIMDPIPYVLRLVLSLLDLNPEHLCSMMEVVGITAVNTEAEDGDRDGYEEKNGRGGHHPLVVGKAETRRNSLGLDGGTGGSLASKRTVLYCGRDEDEEYEIQLSRLRNSGRRLQGDLPFTARSLMENENQSKENLTPALRIADPVKRMMLGINTTALQSGHKVLWEIDGNTANVESSH
jgi:hypothetical protein